MERESLELLLARGLSVEKIGRRFGKDRSTVSYWMKKYGLETPNRKKYAARGGIDRDVLERLVEQGMTIGGIAAELGLSPGTVQYWLRRHALQTKQMRDPQARDALRAAKDEGLLTVTKTCAHHGETDFFLEGRGYYRCKRCRSAAVARRRRKVKTILVAEAGGRCCICGYDRCPAALEFHHLEPSTKLMPLSAEGVAYAIETLRAEATKCVLLCANCHAEVENGIASVPLQ